MRTRDGGLSFTMESNNAKQTPNNSAHALSNNQDRQSSQGGGGAPRYQSVTNKSQSSSNDERKIHPAQSHQQQRRDLPQTTMDSNQSADRRLSGVTSQQSHGRYQDQGHSQLQDKSQGQSQGQLQGQSQRQGHSQGQSHNQGQPQSQGHLQGQGQPDPCQHCHGGKVGASTDAGGMRAQPPKRGRRTISSLRICRDMVKTLSYRCKGKGCSLLFGGVAILIRI